MTVHIVPEWVFMMGQNTQNIQNDKKVQVIIFKDSELGDKVEALKTNSTDELDKLIVKPSIPSFYLGASS